MDIVEQAEASMCRDNVGCKPDVCVCGIMDDMKDEIKRLRAENAELLKALTDLYEVCRWEKVAPEIDAARAAIAKATGGE